MKRSQFLKSVAVIPFAPLAIPLLESRPFDPIALAKEIEAEIEAAVEEIGPSTDMRYAATGEEVISYVLGGTDLRDTTKMLKDNLGWMSVIVEDAIRRGGPNPVALYWRQKPIIDTFPERPGYWRFMTRFLVSKKIQVSNLLIIDGRDWLVAGAYYRITFNLQNYVRGYATIDVGGNIYALTYQKDFNPHSPFDWGEHEYVAAAGGEHKHIIVSRSHFEGDICDLKIKRAFSINEARDFELTPIRDGERECLKEKYFAFNYFRA